MYKVHKIALQHLVQQADVIRKDMAQINHNSAANALRDLVHITNLGDRPYLVDIYVDKEEKPGIINILLN